MAKDSTVESFYEVYNPAPSILVKKLGAAAAIVWGRVLRYEEIGDPGYCFASYATLARETGLGMATVRRNIELLISEGYVTEIDPPEAGKRLHRARKLITTDKLRIGIKAYQKTEDDQNEHPTLEDDQNEHPRMIKVSNGMINMSIKQSIKTNESLSKEDLLLSKDKKRKLRKEINAHWKTGPGRDKRLDNYYELLHLALVNNQELPKKPRLKKTKGSK